MGNKLPGSHNLVVRTPGNLFRSKACGRKAVRVLARRRNPEMPPKNPSPGASPYNNPMKQETMVNDYG